MKLEYDIIRIDKQDGSETIEPDRCRIHKMFGDTELQQFDAGHRLYGQFANYELRLKGMPLFTPSLAA